MKRIFTALLILSAFIVSAQENEGDTLSSKAEENFFLPSKKKFRRHYNSTLGIVYRFTDNPAITGFMRDFNRYSYSTSHGFNAGYFAQWPGNNISQGDEIFRAPSGYFFTYELTIGKKEKNSLGFNFKRGYAGYSYESTAGISYSHAFYFSSYSQLRLGLTVNYFQRAVDFSQLTYGDMIDSRYGYVYETQEMSPTPSVGFLDFNLGGFLKIRQLQLGGSVISVTQPDMGFLGLSRKPWVWFLHAQYDFHLTRKLTIYPYLQTKLSQVNTYNAGIMGNVMEKYLFGVSLENMNSVRGVVGYQLKGKYRLHLAGGIPLQKELRAFSYAAYVEGGFRFLLSVRKKKKEVENEE